MILFNQLVFGGNDLLSGGQWIANPDGKYIGMGISVALCGFLGITLNVIGYQLGDASKVAWMEYLDLIFAFIFQYAIFKEPPNMWEWIGLACLLSTCLLHLGEELIKYYMAKDKVNSLKSADAESEALDTLDPQETKQTYDSAATYTAIKSGGGEGVDEEQKTVEISG